MRELLPLLAAGGAGLILFAAATALRRPGRLWRIVVPAMALIAVTQVPALWRDGIVAGLLATLCLCGGGGWAATFAVGGITMALAAVFPGGVVALGIGIVAIVAVTVTRGSLRHLLRLRRTRTLEPGTAPDRDVEIGGTAAGAAVELPPGANARAVWWRAERQGIERSSDALRLETGAGTVLVDPHGGDVKLSDARAAYVTADAGEVHALFGTSRDEAEQDEADHEDKCLYNLVWLERGDEVYVAGRPVWERGPADMAGYRDAPLVPLFRGKGVLLVNRSVVDVRREAVYRAIAWPGWFLATGAVATAMFLGWI